MKLKISHKLIGLIIALTILVGLAGAAGVYGTLLLSKNLDFIMGPAWSAADGAMEATIDLQADIIETEKAVLSKINTGRTKLPGNDNIESARENIERMITSGLFTAELQQQTHDRIEKFLRSRQRMLKTLDKATLNETTLQASAQYSKEVTRFLDYLAEMEEIGDSKVEGTAEQVESAKQAAITLITIATLAGLALAVFAYLMTKRQIIFRLDRIAHMMQDVAEGEGDLTANLPAQGQDEIGDVARAFNTFVNKLRGIVIELQGNSADVNNAAESMSHIAEQSLQSMAVQQRETDQVAAAINEMASSIHEVAENAARASQTAEQANDSVTQGQRQVTQTTSAIGKLADEIVATADVLTRLEGHVENIGSVLDVIKSIAEQTNLLALNAAIEAARAGEQGRGFAVVADEVRTLASRTHDSTSEIEEMIVALQQASEQAVTAMRQGRDSADEVSNQAQQANDALLQINEAVKAIVDRNVQIASASEEQGSVAKEISESINKIHHLAQQTESQAEANAGSSQEMVKLAFNLQKLTATFKTA